MGLEGLNQAKLEALRARVEAARRTNPDIYPDEAGSVEFSPHPEVVNLHRSLDSNIEERVGSQILADNIEEVSFRVEVGSRLILHVNKHFHEPGKSSIRITKYVIAPSINPHVTMALPSEEFHINNEGHFEVYDLGPRTSENPEGKKLIGAHSPQHPTFDAASQAAFSRLQTTSRFILGR